MNYLSDIVQRVSRAPRWRSRIDNRFKGWPQMLFNAVMDFAVERGFRTLYSPTADLALRHTDPARQVRRELFDRVYDAAVAHRVEARRENDWWVVPIRRNRRRCVRSERVENAPSASSAASDPVVCVLHDVERGWGHLDVDPGFTERADRVGRESLPRMLAVERDLGVCATYNVVGTLLCEIRAEIERDRHALAFHSFDHRLDRPDQLARCRGVDYRLRGYRPPRSLLTPELVDGSLLRRGFAWIASAEPTWQRRGPRLEEGLVRIPVHLDDYPLHTGAQRYEEWELALLERVARAPLTVFGLHDCYGDRWLPGYPRLLRRLGEIATFRTLDQISNQAILAAAC
jgi:hypothetical protein